MSNFPSFLSNANPAFIENLYKEYLQNPESVDQSWSLFFKGFDFASNGNGTAAALTGANVSGEIIATSDLINKKELAVLTLIDGFRHRGHLLSTTNPLKPRKDRAPHLDFIEWGLEKSDLDKVFNVGELIGLKGATLQQILDRMNQVYCGHIGFEYSNIENHEKRLWLRQRIENRPLSDDYGLSLLTKRRILEKLNGAVGFEDFLDKKYATQKRFSLEGGETTIPALDAIINTGADDKVEEVIIGMAHRGRLNVLANILGKTYEHIFNEFEGAVVPDHAFGSGDVKYHLGYSSQVETTAGKKVHLKLAPNPSHLECVNAVIEGFARAKADILYNSDYDRILPILIHGDAAVAGLGIGYELVQMSQLPGYFTGGTIHFVINNQIGFTTDFDDARSSTYSTGIANVIQAPVFHVNGDDPEAVVYCCQLAVEYRQKFNNDVFIDMVCYRRHGHNETDNPNFTQPKMYNFIKDHPDSRKIYIDTLVNRGDMDKNLAQAMELEFDEQLQARLQAVKQNPLPYKYQEPEMAWRSLKKITTEEDYANSPETGIDRATIDKVLAHLQKAPEGFNLVKDVNRYIQGKQKLIDENKLDWGYGELLAYSSILLENKDVRLSGEDVKRGTFSHRHAVFYDTDTDAQYNRLATISNLQGQFRIYNSLLSEFGVLGFEYGYAMANPETLVIWEGQFGDFVNGAQTIIDQFIASGESKWQRQNGLVMLLPHGYEGQGPEHSSARLERLLQSCAENNMTIANVSTPANFFHLIRRQLARPFRKPLAIMSPKSLLRHPLCVSDIKQFETGNKFEEVIDDASISNAKGVKKVALCTGKIYYDLLTKQIADARKDVAIVRVEQIYPFPEAKIKAIQQKYSAATAYWVQEEPANMGSWMFIASFHADLALKYIGRKATASPATGYLKVHNAEQASLVEQVFS